MPVNLPIPDAASILPVSGVRLGVACAGIKTADRKDLLVISLSQGSNVAGVFTREVAETKIQRVERMAREQEFPLRLTMEPEEEEDE